MKYSTVLALGSALTGALAMPAANKNPFKRGTAPSDLQVLQYALTLENLEANFYATLLSTFSKDDFCNAGFPDWVRGRVSQIAQHEKSHVALLSAALGNNTVAPCTYAFPLTDPKTAIGFAAFLENIGVSAYAGANQYISDATYRTVAATILPVEARHQGFFNGPVMWGNDWTGPYDTPLGLDMVYTLAAQVITSCPSSNAALPVTAATPLTTADGSPFFAANGGDTVVLNYKGSGASGLMAAVYNGLGATMVPYNANGQVTLPQGLQGFSYILITSATDIGSVSTANTVAGPAVIDTVFDAFQSNPGFMNPYGA